MSERKETEESHGGRRVQSEDAGRSCRNHAGDCMQIHQAGTDPKHGAFVEDLQGSWRDHGLSDGGG